MSAVSRQPNPWVIVGVSTIQQAGLTFIRFGLPALGPFIRQESGLALGQVGLLFGALDAGALLTFYLAGRATVRFGERAILAGGALLTGVLTALAALIPGFWPQAGLLAVAGAGLPSSHLAGSQAIVRLMPPERRGLAMGIRQAGLPLGGLTAAALLPAVAGAAGWRTALVVAGLVCAATGLLALGLVPAEPAGRPADLDGLPGSGPGVLLKDRVLLRSSLAGCLLVVGQFCLTGYLPLYLVDHFGWAQADAARTLTLVHAGAIAGRLSWGWVSDRTFKGERVRTLSLVALLGAVVLGAVILVSVVNGVGWLGVALVAFGAGFTLLGWQGLHVALVAEVSPVAPAIALGLAFTGIYAFSMASPPLFGRLVEVTGSYAAGWAALIPFQLGTILTLSRLNPSGRPRRG